MKEYRTSLEFFPFKGRASFCVIFVLSPSDASLQILYHQIGIFYQLESILFIHLLLAQHCGRQVFLCLLMTCAGCNSLGLIELPEEKGSARVDGWKPWHQLLDCQTQLNWSCSSRAPGLGRSVQDGQVLNFSCRRRTSHVLQKWGKFRILLPLIHYLLTLLFYYLLPVKRGGNSALCS